VTATADELQRAAPTGEIAVSRPRWTKAHGVAAAAIAVAAAAVLWVPPLRSSLWLDETGTVWLTGGSLGDSLGHAFRFQGGSPLYYVIEWTTRAVMGRSELALRIPSLAAMAGAAWLLFRLGNRLFDAGTGALASVLFVALPVIGFAAGDARPYALAMLALIGSGLALVRWLDSGSTRDAIVYAVAASATVYLHYLFALPLLAHVIYVILRLEHGAPVTKRMIVGTYAFAAALLVPALPTLLRVMSQRSVLSNPYPQSAGSIVAALVPGPLAVISVGGCLVGLAIWRGTLRGWNAENGALPWLIGWFAVTFLVLVILSEATSTDVMVPRYFLSVVPAMALLAAAIIRRVGNAWSQVVIVAAVAIGSVFSYSKGTHTSEDWREAAAIERGLAEPGEPVLFSAGFIEAQQVSWLEDAEKASYLNAPAAMYDFDGELIPLPFALNRGGAGYLETELRGGLASADHFVLVTRGRDVFRDWLDERLAGEGFTSTLEASLAGEILIYEFERDE
jgi:mannosyltransferase